MSVLSVQNMQETFVGAVGKARTGSVQVTDPNNTTTYITDGEIVVVNNVGTVINTGTASTYDTTPFIQVVTRVGNELVWSSKIPANGVISYAGKAGSQGQEQIYHIGYNPTLTTPTGSLDTSSGLDFMLTLIENQDDMQWSEQKKKNVVYVPSNLVTTQLSLASAIVKNQMKKYMTDGSAVTAAMVNGGAAATIGATTATVTHGGTTVTYSGAHSLTAGSVVRLGISSPAASGIGVGVPVYTVKEVPTTTTVVLDQPYAGPSSTIANADHGVIAAPATNWGVRFTGKALPFRRDFFKFKRVSFTLQMSGFGTTLLSKSQESTYGSGDGRLVLEEESFSKGFEGALNRMTVPLPLANETFQASATTGVAALVINAVNCGDVVTTSTPGGAANLYDCIMIGFFAKNRQTVVASPDMMQMIKIFSPNTAGQNSGAATDIRETLNIFMAQARVGSFANVAAASFQ
jgi:hypothetical protein